MNPKYPIYIPSKGRSDSRLTAKELDRLGVDYRIVVEPQEFNVYALVIPESKILTLPDNNQGLVFSRNWIWEHALLQGADWFWMLDDNIQAFWRLNKNLRIRVSSGTIFKCAEDFVSRYENIAMAGMNYYMFARDWSAWPAFYVNTRIYSCFLIKSDIGFRFNPGFNDDTDISLRILKTPNLCTVLFDAFLAQKAATMSVKGGLTEYYKEHGRKEISEDLQRRHPDCVKVIRRWNRWHHYVDYSIFKHKRLVRRSDWNFSGINNYGMKLTEVLKQKKEIPKQDHLQLLTEEKKPTQEFNQDYWKDRGFSGKDYQLFT